MMERGPFRAGTRLNGDAQAHPAESESPGAATSYRLEVRALHKTSTLQSFGQGGERRAIRPALHDHVEPLGFDVLRALKAARTAGLRCRASDPS
jgi:hypothetical protein